MTTTDQEARLTNTIARWSEAKEEFLAEQNRLIDEFSQLRNTIGNGCGQDVNAITISHGSCKVSLTYTLSGAKLAVYNGAAWETGLQDNESTHWTVSLGNLRSISAFLRSIKREELCAELTEQLN